MAESLADQGFYSPERIAEADLTKLMEVRGVGEKKAEKLLEAAREWVMARVQAAGPAEEGSDGVQ